MDVHRREQSWPGTPSISSFTSIALLHERGNARKRFNGRQSSHNEHFHPLLLQRFQELLTLFSKSFSPFHHSTSLLSDSKICLALDEDYHPIYAPVPRNVTPRKYTIREDQQAAHGAFTRIGTPFQKAYTYFHGGDTSQHYKSRPKTPISNVSSFLFIRHY